jgi:hypothetical protein
MRCIRTIIDIFVFRAIHFLLSISATAGPLTRRHRRRANGRLRAATPRGQTSAAIFLLVISDDALGSSHFGVFLCARNAALGRVDFTLQRRLFRVIFGVFFLVAVAIAIAVAIAVTVAVTISVALITPITLRVLERIAQEPAIRRLRRRRRAPGGVQAAALRSSRVFRVP